jgi:hypothetical protein
VDTVNLQPKKTQESKVGSFGGMNNTASDAGAVDTNIFSETNPKGP